jgi:hypothetical protein
VYISNIDLARGLKRLQNSQQSASLEGVKVVIEFIKKGRYNKYRIDNP